MHQSVIKSSVIFLATTAFIRTPYIEHTLIDYTGTSFFYNTVSRNPFTPRVNYGDMYCNSNLLVCQRNPVSFAADALMPTAV